MITIDTQNKIKDELYIKGNIFDVSLRSQETIEEHLFKKYQEKGLSYLKSLKGEFSLILWDAKRQILFARSDHLAVIQLYYFKDKNKFYFSNALQNFKKFQLAPNKNHFLEIVVENFSNQSETPFKNLYKLSQGQFLLYNPRKFELQNYWNPDGAKILQYKNSQDYIDQFLDLFKRSIDRRTSPTVKTGLLLSGGFDSSSIAYMAKKSDRDLHLYSMFFEDKTADEKEPLLRVLDDLNFSNKKMVFEELKQEFFKYSLDFNFSGHFYSPGLYLFRPLLEKAKSDGVKQIMTGLGGDDLFNVGIAYQGVFGYENIRRKILEKLPTIFYQNLRKIKQTNQASRYFNKGSLKKIGAFSNQLDSRSSRPISRKIIKNGGYAFSLAQEQALAQKYDLNFTYPLLDIDIFEFVNSLPKAHFKDRGLQKPFFREAMKNIVPDEIRNHRSQQSYSAIGNSILENQKVELLKAMNTSPLVTQGIARNDFLEEMGKRSAFTSDDIDILLKVLYSNVVT
jgi:asparagine synthetase B (glutamine-hydrolysing)